MSSISSRQKQWGEHLAAASVVGAIVACACVVAVVVCMERGDGAGARSGGGGGLVH